MEVWNAYLENLQDVLFDLTGEFHPMIAAVVASMLLPLFWLPLAQWRWKLRERRIERALQSGVDPHALRNLRWGHSELSPVEEAPPVKKRTKAFFGGLLGQAVALLGIPAFRTASEYDISTVWVFIVWTALLAILTMGIGRWIDDENDAAASRKLVTLYAMAIVWLLLVALFFWLTRW